MASEGEIRENILEATGQIDEDEAQGIVDQAADALGGLGRKAKKAGKKAGKTAKRAQRNRQQFQAGLERRRKELEEAGEPTSLEETELF